jgi:glutamate carboxypeptidase
LKPTALACVGLLIATAVPAAAGAVTPDTKVMAAVLSCRHDARPLLEKLVAIDSGTGDAEGLKAVGTIFAAELKAMGGEVRFVPPPAPSVGDNLVASFTGTGKGRILLIAHMDTVFNRGDAARRMPHWDGQHYVGPGAGDDKSGGVAAVCAVRVLKEVGFKDFARIDVLLNASEETGSLGARDLIRSMAKAADVAINLEHGVPGDRVNVARKGSAQLILDFAGRAAHSGLEPEKGRNAALEAARVALELGKLADQAKQTSVVVVGILGGEKNNVVPAAALVRADVRAFTAAEFDRVEKGAAELAARPGIDDQEPARTRLPALAALGQD